MSRIQSTPPQIHAAPAAERTTAPPASRRFRDALGASARALRQGTLSLSTPALRAPTLGRPSGAGAAVAGLTTTDADARAPSPMSSVEAAHAESSTEAVELLELQRRISAQQVQFSTMSNVLKARHETAKSVVSNIR